MHQGEGEVITPLERLQNLEEAALRNQGSEYVRLPDGGALEVVSLDAPDEPAWRFNYWVFDGHPNDGGGQKVDRSTASGLMAWKWSTPLEI